MCIRDRSSLRSEVVDACDPTVPDGWCASMPMPTVEKGILTVTLDERPIAADFEASKRGQCAADGTCSADYNLCMPRDLCYFDGTQCQPCLNDPSKCIRQDDFMSVDLDAMNHIDATGKMPLDVVCQDWGTYASGTTGPTLGELSLVDCPAGGCLGFAFTLVPSFDGNETYAQIGAPLTQCFNQSSWMDDALVARTDPDHSLADPLCGAPRQQMPSDYCITPPTPTPTAGP